MLQNNDQMLGMYRTAAKSANATINILLAGTERMLRHQAEISREILAEYADAAKQIESAADVADLLSIQGRLARMQLEKTATWWAGLYAEIGAGQKELLRSSQAFGLDLAEGLSRTLERVPSTPGTEPVMTAMRLVVDATRSSYAAAAEAHAEAPGQPAAPEAGAKAPGTKSGTKQAAG